MNRSFSAFLLCLLLAGCSDVDTVQERTLLSFGTLIELGYYGIDAELADQATTALEADFAEMHADWHAWQPGSLARINELLATGEPFTGAPSLLPLIRLGQQYERQSRGLFNPAVGKLIALWGFHRDDPALDDIPDRADIEELVAQAPSMQDILIRDISLQGTNPAVHIDLGGYAKGYAVTLALKRLRTLGIDNAIVNAGGDLGVIGRRGHRPWRIGVREPADADVLGSVELHDGESLFTSGNYERGYVIDGKRYHHIIDPRTGFPATGIASVTVLHHDATTADAAATALLVAGMDDWPEIAARMGVSHALVVDDNGVIELTPDMAARITLADRSRTTREVTLPAPTGL